MNENYNFICTCFPHVSTTFAAIEFANKSMKIKAHLIILFCIWMLSNSMTVLPGDISDPDQKLSCKKIAIVCFIGPCDISSVICYPTEREVERESTIYPISDDFDEYDGNGDSLIEYEEFAFNVLARFKLKYPEKLRIIFSRADLDGNGMLDADEFRAAPWYFGKYPVKVQKTPIK